MKIIIFEGLDCTGKSTSIAELYKKYSKEGKKVKIIHVTGKMSNTYEWYLSLYKKAIDDAVEVLIFDRWAIGEFVYGLAYRDKTRISFNEILNLLEINKQFDVDISYQCIMFKRVTHEMFDKYYDVLAKRDNEEIENREINILAKKLEQATFISLLTAIRDTSSVNIITSYFGDELND